MLINTQGRPCSFSSCKIGLRKTETLDSKKKPEAEAVEAGGKVKKGDLQARRLRGETPLRLKPVLVRGLGRYSRGAVYSRKALSKTGIQQLHPGLKRKRRKVLLLSQNQSVATTMVVPQG